MKPTPAQESKLRELEQAADAALAQFGIESREYADALCRAARYHDQFVTVVYSDGATSAAEHYVNETWGR